MPSAVKKKQTLPLIGFRLVKIETKQFASFPDSLVENIEMKVSAHLKFGFISDLRTIVCGFQYEMEASEKLLLVIEVACLFALEQKSWLGVVNNNKINLPRGFARHLGVITAGTTRGVLHAKTENTVFNQYPMALVNVETMLDEDIIVGL